MAELIEELHKIECVSLPGSGTCSAMFTANTMSSAVEALGMALPGSAAHPVVVPCAAPALPKPTHHIPPKLTATNRADPRPWRWHRTTGQADRLNPQKITDCEDAAKALMSMLSSGLRSRDIIDRKAVENAIVIVYAMGGSTSERRTRLPLSTRTLSAASCAVCCAGNGHLRPLSSHLF